MIEALFEFLAACLGALADLFWHSLRARSSWWWIPPALVSTVLVVFAWVFRESETVPIVLLALAALPLLARALLMRRDDPKPAGRG